MRLPRPLRRLGDAVWLMKRHRRRLGRGPNPLRPRTLNDWVMRRLMLAPEPLHAQFCCKLGQRRFKAERIGEAASVPLLGVWDSAEALARDWDALPAAFMLKPTHASSWFRAVPDKAAADKAAILAEAAGWLARSYYAASREIGYRDVVPRLIAETLVRPPEGFPTPRETHLYCFDGRIALATIGLRPREGEYCTSLLDAEGRPLPAYKPGRQPDPLPPPAPAVWARIRELSAALSRGLDFVRCDVLIEGETVWVSELTPYPMGGRQEFEPLPWMGWLGGVWAATRAGRPWPDPPSAAPEA